MANKPKPQDDSSRRAKVEEMRRAQQAKERRKSLLFVAVAAVVGIGLVAAVAIPTYLDGRNDPAKKAVSTFGVAASAAGCDDEEVSSGTNNETAREHVEDGTTGDYETVPPSYGAHWNAPAFPAREFYTARDRPEMEQLVHNLEHGYTVLWYDDTIKGAQLDQLKDIGVSARNNDAVGPSGKFVVSAWDDAYGDMPSGKHIGLSHWGAQDSTIQLCEKVSGEVVQDFIEKYPSTDSPEPGAA